MVRAPVERRGARLICDECNKRHWIADHELTVLYFRVIPVLMLLAAGVALFG